MRSAPDGESMLTLQQAFFEAVAAIARIAGKKKDPVGRQFYRLGVREEAGRQPLRQVRKQIGGSQRRGHQTPGVQ